MKIESVKVKRILDDTPDSSCTGEYTDNAEDWSICRCCGEYVANCDEDHNFPEKGREYRFFTPYACGEKTGSPDYQKYGKQDYNRMESLNRGDWCFIGIIAEAEISYPVTGSSNGHRRLESFSSGGLWGIESDSGDDYLERMENEQLDDLWKHLKQFGINVVLNSLEIEREEIS